MSGPEAIPNVSPLLDERMEKAFLEASPELPPVVETDQYIVVLEDSVKHPRAVAETQAEEADGEVGLVYRSALKGYSATLPKDEVEALEEDPRVDYVTLDRKVKLFAQTTPTGISRIGTPSNESLRVNGQDDMRVDVDVAVIDTGIDPGHPDLDVVGRTNCVPSGPSEATKCVDAAGTDGYGHGTHVAGTIGALDNGEGVVGVAPGARLWAVKVLDGQGSGYTSWIIAGVDWVTAHADQIEVANMSLGCECSQPALDEAIEASVEAGVVYAVAAGNSHADSKDFSPANHPDVITVSALADYNGVAGGGGAPTCGNAGTDDSLASFSNYGKDVEVAAPGVCILSTIPGGKYASLSGTSMASPHVAGAAAIRASAANPEDAEDVEAIREEIEEEGNLGWVDNSGDGVKEPLLDVSDEAAFDAEDQVAVTRGFTLSSTSEATLHGTVNPNGIETEYWFQYGETASYGLKAPTSPESVEGDEYASVNEVVKDLKGQTLYHYRLVVSNENGTFYGADRVLGTTVPASTMEAASEIDANAAELTAVVNPEGLDTTYSFEFGTTTSYGRKALASDDAIGSGTEGIEATAVAGGLNGETTYHYRVAATNVAGTAYGEDKTFTTGSAEWHVQERSDPVENKDGYTVSAGFSGVSCGGDADCMAVGGVWWWPEGEPEAYEEGLLAERWDGSKWEEIPLPEGELGFEEEFLGDISCPSAEVCMAVGTAQPPGTNGWLGYSVPIVDTWNGSSWTRDDSPMSPAEYKAGNKSHLLLSVSCSSTSHCMAVGFRRIVSEGGKYPEEVRPWTLEWDGEDWSVVPSPHPVGTESASLQEVSCTSPESCIAIGSFYGHDGATGVSRPLVEEYDGKEWSLASGTAAAEGPYEYLYKISCTGSDLPSTKCTAVKNNSEITHFDGEEWSAPEMTPMPPGGDILGWREIECTTPTVCKLVGVYRASGRVRPVVEHWDGIEWQIESSIDPTSDGAYSELSDISCFEARCVATGGFATAVPGESWALAEGRQGAATAKTDMASGVDRDQATLNATVNPHGLETTYRFEYGITTSYGTKVPVPDKAIGSGTGGVEVDEDIGGLESGTTYHFRVAATNAEGTRYGKDATFTTDAEPGFVFAFGQGGSGNGQFSAPLGVTVDSAGNVWVADNGNNRIQKFNSKGEYVSKFGTYGSGNGQLSEPFGVAVDSAGNIWVADTWNHRIQKFNSKGEYVSKFGTYGSGNGQLKAPMGIIIDSAGNVWVADYGNNRIQKFNSSGTYLSQFGSKGSGNGQLDQPYGIAIDSAGNVWVADYGNNRIQKFNSKGEYVSKFGTYGSGNGQLSEPLGVTVDSAGNVWVADSGNNRIQKFNSSGTYLSQFGSQGSGNGHFLEPGNVAVDPEDDLWVTDTGNNRVQKWAGG